MLTAITDSKFFIGIIMIAMNLWGRYIVDEISESEEEYRRNIILRRIAIFAVCYAATRDLLVSLSLTAGFVILAMGVSRRGPEGMTNPSPSPERVMRKTSGLGPDVDKPAYDKDVKPLFAE
jgi:hypothetical protein